MIRFLPVLAYNANSMKRLEGANILDMAMSDTSTTLLVRRCESALLVNVDRATLQAMADLPQGSVRGFARLLARGSYEARIGEFIFRPGR